MNTGTIGVMGGGQLARMLALAAAPLGLRLRVIDPSPDSCASAHADWIRARYDEAPAIARFADGLAGVTFDFENVPAAIAEQLESRLPVVPNARALAVAQDRLSEKTLFGELGIPVPAFLDIPDKAALASAVGEMGLPAILKTRRLGYDGKGQFRLKPRPGTAGSTSAGMAEAVDSAWSALGQQAANTGLILEGFVPFQAEYSVIAVRGRDDDFRAWPVTRNWHVDGVLSLSLAPAGVAEELQAQAIAHARRLAQALDYVGVFALELFCVDGQLIANEMAPRVHNSGHWTIEGAETSQFENHLRAVAGLPLGSTAIRGHACMLNFIGEMPDRATALQVPGLHWHDYGKTPRIGRKVGHATLRADSAQELQERLRLAGRLLGREMQVQPAIEALARADSR